MFGSTNPFGQSSNSPFGAQPAFGQTSTATNNPFAPKPFGTTNTSSPFGAQTGSSIFGGGTSTGVFGAQPSSSPFGATTPFGASSSPAFGSSTPAFGASSTPAFGTSAFGQKPAFGGFGSTTPSSPFGNTTQQSQPAFGNTMFGSTPFGAASTPAFGATSSPAFGQTSAPAFGSTPTPAFGSTGTPFGASSGPVFGSTNTSVFGASSTPAFGASSTPAFGQSSTPAFGTSNTPAFGAPSSPSFSFGSAPAFGQSASSFGSSQFGTTTSSPFGAQSSPFGAQSTASTFGNTAFGQQNFGGQQRGSRVVPYSPTTEADTGKLESISAMPTYKDKSHEELRWEDYQAGDKGGPLPAGQQQPGGVSFNATSTAPTNPFGASSSAFGQSTSNPFSTTTPANPFAAKTSPFGSTGFGTTSNFSPSPFNSTTPISNPFASTPMAAPSVFGPSSTPTTAFGSSSSLFNSTTSTPLFSSPSIFSATAPSTTTAFNTGLNLAPSQTSPLFNSSIPSNGQTASPFGQTSPFGPTPAFPQTSAFAPNTQSNNMFSSTFTGSTGNPFPSTPSMLPSNSQGNFVQSTPSLSTPFQQSQPGQTSNGFAFNSFSQTPAGNFSNTTGIFAQNNPNQSTLAQSSQATQQPISLSPFGTLPIVPQMSIGRGGSAPSIQYGISSMPVADKPAPVRISSLLTSRHVSQRRIRMPVRKYNPKTDGSKVPFFSDEEETASTPKADALFIPRENPRALVIRPMEQWNSRPSAEKAAPVRDGSTPVHENGKIAENGSRFEDKGKNPVENGAEEERPNLTRPNQKSNGVHDNHTGQKDDSYKSLSGHRAGEAAIAYEHGADIEALMPKLRRSDYYTEPRIQELAAKERAEPGFCRRVKDFVVGRHGYGSIKFFGETDVRRLDLESLVQFNNREVIVYMDDSKKPPVGQGLNKPAEVCLLNIKCFDKKTGRQFTEGPKVEKYKDMLKKKAEDQGAEFVSYDAVKGEWKFKVDHFSEYKLDKDQEWDTDC